MVGFRSSLDEKGRVKPPRPKWFCITEILNFLLPGFWFYDGWSWRQNCITDLLGLAERSTGGRFGNVGTVGDGGIEA
jgi:hypothetical protein